MGERSFFNDSIRLMDPSHQKRKKARTPVNIQGEFSLDGKKEIFECTLTDIGTGGLSFISKMSLYVGDRLLLRFRLNSQTIELPVAVVRVAGKHTGAQFSSIKDESLQIVQNFIHTSFFEKEKKKN